MPIVSLGQEDNTLTLCAFLTYFTWKAFLPASTTKDKVKGQILRTTATFPGALAWQAFYQVNYKKVLELLMLGMTLGG